MQDKVLIASGREYRYEPTFKGVMTVKPVTAADGCYFAMMYDAGALMPTEQDAIPYQQPLHYLSIQLADLKWLAEMMTPMDGSYERLEGICIGAGSIVSSLRGHLIRAVKMAETVTTERPVLRNDHVESFLAMSGLTGPVTIELGADWAALHDASGKSAYARLRDNGMDYPSYYNFLSHSHKSRMPWGEAERQKYQEPRREAFDWMRLPAATLYIDKGLLRGTPDGTLCYSPQSECNHILIDGPTRAVCISLSEHKGEAAA